MRIQTVLTIPSILIAIVVAIAIEFWIVPKLEGHIHKDFIERNELAINAIADNIEANGKSSLDELENRLQKELNSSNSWLRAKFLNSDGNISFDLLNPEVIGSGESEVWLQDSITHTVNVNFNYSDAAGILSVTVKHQSEDDFAAIRVVKITGILIFSLLMVLAGFTWYYYLLRVRRPISSQLEELQQNLQDKGISTEDIIDSTSDLRSLVNVISRLHLHKDAGKKESNSTSKTIMERTGLSTEHYLNAILENIVDGIITTDCFGRIISANKAAERIFAYDGSELIGKNVSILMAKEDKDKHDYYLERYNHVRKPGIIGRGREVIGVKKNGEPFYLDLAISEVRYENEVIYVGILRDITLRKRAEAGQRESEDRFRAIFEGARDGILILNSSDLEFRSSNRRFRQLMGIADNEVLRQVFLSPFYKEEDITWIKTEIAEIATGERKSLFSVPFHHSDGRVLYFDISGFPLSIGGQSLLVLMYHDVSHKVVVEKALQGAKDAAELANQQKSEFLANMTHEIRTPMNGLLGMLDLLQTSELNENQLEELSIAQRCGDTLMTLLNDILDLSKIEANKIVFEDMAFSPRILVDDVIRLMKANAQSKGVKLSAGSNEKLPSMLVGDPTRIRQILSNLVSNGIKFTDDGGVVSVRASFDASQELCFKLEVEDSGVGIKDDIKESLFEKFTQADGSITRKYGGTGLGLNICKGLVEGMGGKILLDSDYGKGSTFTIELPLRAASGIVRTTQRDYGSENVLVLVMLDSEVEANSLEDELTKDFDVINISSNKTFDQHGQEHERYVVITNYTPENAYHYRLLVQKLGIDSMFGIALSPTAQRGEGREAQDAGFHGYLAKPYMMSHLREMIITALLQKTTQQTQLLTRFTLEERKQENSLHVLVVEDNVVNQKVVSSMLRKIGCEVDIASNGLDAIQAVLFKNFDLVLMDIQMPEMDGLAATREIRKTQPDLPIIALTANNISDERESYLKAGMNDCLSKPIQLHVLKNLVNKFAA